MPTFTYKAKNKQAQTQIGHVVARNKEEAVEKINLLGLVPVFLEEKDSQGSIAQNLFLYISVKPKTLYIFSRQLASLLRAGVSLLRALEIIGEQMQNIYLKKVIEQTVSGIREGKTFSDCLTAYPNIFFSLYITMVRAGEESGRLHEMIENIAEYLRSQEEIRSKVKTALTYPVLMAVFGVATICYILTFVMPKITGLFSQVKQQLPLPTEIVLILSSVLQHNGLFILIFCGMIFIFLKQWLKTSKGQAVYSRLILRTPFLGDFLLKIELARFSRTLELLIKSGISITRSINLSIPLISNQLIRNQLIQCQEDLISGGTFGASLKRSSLIPSLVGNLISVGEETGSLTETLHELANGYEQETNETIRVITTLLEPVMIIIIGVVIGFLVMAMLLPIFQLDILAS